MAQPVGVAALPNPDHESGRALLQIYPPNGVPLPATAMQKAQAIQYKMRVLGSLQTTPLNAPNDQVILEAMRFANEVSYVPPLAPAAGNLAVPPGVPAYAAVLVGGINNILNRLDTIDNKLTRQEAITSNLSSSRLGVTSLCPVPNAAGVTHPVNEADITERSHIDDLNVARANLWIHHYNIVIPNGGSLEEKKQAIRIAVGSV